MTLLHNGFTCLYTSYKNFICCSPKHSRCLPSADVKHMLNDQMNAMLLAVHVCFLYVYSAVSMSLSVILRRSINENFATRWQRVLRLYFSTFNEQINRKMVTPSSCVIKQYYDGNYHRNCSIKYLGNLPGYFNTRNNRYFYKIGNKLRWYLHPRKSKFYTSVIYHGKLPWYFLTLAPDINSLSLASFIQLASLIAKRADQQKSKMEL
jgi:hypothetical protein